MVLQPQRTIPPVTWNYSLDIVNKNGQMSFVGITYFFSIFAILYGTI